MSERVLKINAPPFVINTYIDRFPIKYPSDRISNDAERMNRFAQFARATRITRCTTTIYICIYNSSPRSLNSDPIRSSVPLERYRERERERAVAQCRNALKWIVKS